MRKIPVCGLRPFGSLVLRINAGIPRVTCPCDLIRKITITRILLRTRVSLVGGCGPLHDGIPDAQTARQPGTRKRRSAPLKIAPRPVNDHTALPSHPTDAANISKHSQNDSTGTPQTLRLRMTRRPAHLARDPEY